MNPTQTSILNYDTVDLLREKLHYRKATPKDFETIEDLLEAFGRPRNLILHNLRPYTIYSYEEFMSQYKKHNVRGLGRVMGRTLYYLDRMAEYFLKKENLQPDIWELKNPSSL